MKKLRNPVSAMKIGLLSDTHGELPQEVFTHFQDCDELWHAGDIGHLGITEVLGNFKKIRAVYGNIDPLPVRLAYPGHQRFVVAGLDVLMTHIAGTPPSYTPYIQHILKENPPAMLVAGHSHILRVERDRHGVLYVNPGAAGQHGIHKVRTLITFEIENGKPTNMQVIELPAHLPR